MSVGGDAQGKTARKIVRHFGAETLDARGIARRKLETIGAA